MNWRMRRKKDRLAQWAYFQDHSLCEVCGRPAVQVHEIVLRSQGGKCVPDNMISLCLDDHDRTHFLRKPYLRKEGLFEIKRKEEKFETSRVEKTRRSADRHVQEPVGTL